ncbi:ribonuclease T2 family protein [Enterovirga aerilata]|uniref:Ribonuclease T2 n=1 Tax=Enterovirga aerilata TaxID=2730920 RepID=A0A849HVB4_9HYPH|nr:ribonuclease T2 [Enterovirga sp. DB1703]NNM71052.1 ribonuclease T2 [Enterovirga sp. DB1703]
MRRRLGAALAGLVALLLPAGPTLAQERGRPGDFDFYVLALSWSPAFCEATGAARGSRQCDPGRRLGFVVHGLWPQYERGYPTECDSRPPPRYVVEETSDIFPDAGLARHQWRRHGTCSGLDPGSYFRAVRRAREMVRIPDPLQSLSRDGQTTGASVERAFAEVNPGLRPDMMAVTCRRGELREVRICLEKDLSGFRRCPQVDREACRFGPIRVTAPR